MLQAIHYQKILSFTAEVQKANDHYCQKVLQALQTYFNFSHTAFFLKDYSYTTPVASTLNENLLAEYHNTFHKYEIFHNETVLSSKPIVTTTDLIEENVYKASSYYKDFLDKYQYDHTLALNFITNNQTIGGIGIHKHKSEGPFTTNELNILALLNETITYSLIHHLSCNQLSIYEELLNGFLSLENQVFLVVNEKFQLFNTKINQHYYTRVNNYQEFNLNIEQLLNYLRKNHCVLFNKSILYFEDYQIEIIPKEQKDGIVSIDKRYYVIVITRPHSISQKIQMTEHFKKYKLTPREIEIILLVLDGCTNQQISEALYLSINTIKTHLKNIFVKLDIPNRAAIFKKLNGPL